MYDWFVSKGNCAGSICALVATVFISGCGSDAQETNFDRSDDFTEIASRIDTSAPSDVSGLQGQATYRGVATADFGGFGGTADANLTANFKDRTISGNMSDWEDLDPANHKLRGEILLSNGTIADNGSFSTAMVGNIERTVRIGETNPANVPVLKVFAGAADGQIYDSVTGETASHVIGAFAGDASDGGTVSGQFVAGQ